MRLVSILFATLIAPALWVAAYSLTRNAVVAHLSAAIMLTFTDFFAQVVMGVRPQVFMTAFLAMTFAAFARDRFALSGALAVAAFLCWQPALLVFFALLAALTWRESPLRPLLRCAAGGVAMFLLYEAYFVYHGALREQLRQSFTMAGDLSGFALPAIGESLTFVLSGGPWSGRWWMILPALYLAFLTAIVVETYTRPREVFATARRDSLATALAVGAFATLAFTFIDHQAYPDRYFIQPFVALANGIVIGWALCRAAALVVHSNDGRVRLSGVVFALTLVAAAAKVTPAEIGPNVGMQAQRRLANYTMSIRERYGSLWAIGCPHLLALKRTANYDPIGLLIDPRVRAYAADRGIDGIYRPNGGKMPNVILAARHGVRTALPWIGVEYRKVTDAALNRQGVAVLIRKECLDDAPCSAALTCKVLPACAGATPPAPPAKARKVAKGRTRATPNVE